MTDEPVMLLTGGSGRLGAELQKLRKFAYVPTHEEMDITDSDSVSAYLLDKHINFIIHAAAYTDVVKAETDRLNCYKTNVTGTVNLGMTGVPIILISSEYAANPVNYYSQTKRAAEQCAARSLRVLFKPRPFPFEQAFEDQFTSGDYIDVIAKEINIALGMIQHLPQVINIGTGKKSIYELAKQTRPDVKPISRKSIEGVELPEDTSVPNTMWLQLKKKYVR